MKNINKYENLAAYDADTNRPANENTVSLIKDINIIKRKGVNVIVPSIYCSVGDTVVYVRTIVTGKQIGRAHG